MKIVENLSDAVGVNVDPSMPEEERTAGTNRTSKMIIDATKLGKGSFPEECMPKRDVMERVEVERRKCAVD